jgi:peptidoglycan hydrolase-like protein with peptidoglycan-binding domain
MMKRMGLAGVCAALLLGTAAFAEDVALVIGIERYDNLSRVRGADDTAKTISRAYRDQGFDVITTTNVRAEQFAQQLRRFEDARVGADRLIIHFIGQVAWSGQNLRLAPRDLRTGSLVGQSFASAPLDLLYELLDDRPGRSALIIATPYGEIDEAIAHGPHIPQGVLVIAGAPNEVAQAVRNDLVASGLDAVSLARNNPDITVAGYVSDQPLFGQAPVAPTTSANTQQNDAFAEMDAWRAASQDGSRAALEGYINAYPRGLFLGEAKARLEALTPAEQRAEQALNLSRAERREVQEQLTLLGFDTRGVDGVFGRGSRTAITRWQQSAGYKASGYLDITQLRALRRAAADAEVEQRRQQEEADKERDAQDLRVWQQTGASGQERDLREYLQRFPNGLFASQAKRALEEIEANRGVRVDRQAEAKENGLGLNSRTRILVEQRLAGLNLSPGRVDGTFDENTRIAIAEFQRARNLPATGYLTNETVGQLIASIFR